MSKATSVAETLIFTAFVPSTVAGLIPSWLRRSSNVAANGLEKYAAIAVIAVGIGIYLYNAFWSFAWIAEGTPAPMAPTKTLVVHGLHRFVRNPMYIGVGCIIGGQAWLFHSRHLAIYLLLFFAIVHLFVVFYEEPALLKQFGEQYASYRRRVPRWLPRIGL